MARAKGRARPKPSPSGNWLSAHGAGRATEGRARSFRRAGRQTYRPDLSNLGTYRYCPVATRSIERPPLVSSPWDVIVRM